MIEWENDWTVWVKAQSAFRSRSVWEMWAARVGGQWTRNRKPLTNKGSRYFRQTHRNSRWHPYLLHDERTECSWGQQREYDTIARLIHLKRLAVHERLEMCEEVVEQDALAMGLRLVSMASDGEFRALVHELIEWILSDRMMILSERINVADETLRKDLMLESASHQRKQGTVARLVLLKHVTRASLAPH